MIIPAVCVDDTRAGFKGGGGPGPRPPTNRELPTKPVIFYLSFMLVVYMLRVVYVVLLFYVICPADNVFVNATVLFCIVLLLCCVFTTVNELRMSTFQ